MRGQIDYTNRVDMRRFSGYDAVELKAAVIDMLKEFGLEDKLRAAGNAMIKPNMVAGRDPALGVTTHPELIKAIVLALAEYVPAGNIIIADSPGGPVSDGILKSFYGTCGYTDVAKETGAKLGFDQSTATLHSKTRKYEFVACAAEAGFIVNAAKLKTHTFTLMSGAVKNMFGCLPGLNKTEYHALYPDKEDFGGMLCDLCDTLAPDLSVIDGILGMEGNGPTGGKARAFGCLIASPNPFAADLAGAAVLGLNPEEIVTAARSMKLGYVPSSADKLEYTAEKPEAFAVENLLYPDTHVRMKALITRTGGFYRRYLTPRPAVNAKCVGCGLCVKSCPKKIVSIKGKKACIAPAECIKCYCCQELCPKHAIDAKKPALARLFRM